MGMFLIVLLFGQKPEYWRNLNSDQVTTLDVITIHSMENMKVCTKVHGSSASLHREI